MGGKSKRTGKPDIIDRIAITGGKWALYFIVFCFLVSSANDVVTYISSIPVQATIVATTQTGCAGDNLTGHCTYNLKVQPLPPFQGAASAYIIYGVNGSYSSNQPYGYKPGQIVGVRIHGTSAVLDGQWRNISFQDVLAVLISGLIIIHEVLKFRGWVTGGGKASKN